jgi:hypothetical protein
MKSNKKSMGLRALLAVIAMLIIPSLVFAAPAKRGWKRHYRMKNGSAQELLIACGYGNIKACYTYHRKYILTETGKPADN